MKVGRLAAVVAVLVAGACSSPQGAARSDAAPSTSPAAATVGETLPPLLPASRCQEPRPSVVVFMNTGATQDQIEVVALDLSQTDGVEHVEYVGQDATYALFAELFADSPEMVDAVRPEDLPTSFLVVVADGSEQPVADAIEQRSGVKTTVVDPCSQRPG